jgi:monoterpene epsilon-lactone hydrolase
VFEIMDIQWRMIARFLDEADAAVTVPLYPLAPESTCEQIFQFVLGVYHMLQNAGKPIVVIGDSSGGAMALSLSQQLRDAGATQPAKLVLLSPWLDVTCSDPAQTILDRSDPLLALPGLRQAGIWYAGKSSPTDARVSPLYGDLAGLPPILVLTGTHDPSELRRSPASGVDGITAGGFENERVQEHAACLAVHADSGSKRGYQRDSGVHAD